MEKLDDRAELNAYGHDLARALHQIRVMRTSRRQQPIDPAVRTCWPASETPLL